MSSVEGVKSQLIAQMAENEADFCVSQSFKVSIKENVHDYPIMFSQKWSYACIELRQGTSAFTTTPPSDG